MNIKKTMQNNILRCKQKDETQPENKAEEKKDGLPTKRPVRKNENPFPDEASQLLIFLHILVVY